MKILLYRQALPLVHTVTWALTGVVRQPLGLMQHRPHPTITCIHPALPILVVEDPLEHPAPLALDRVVSLEAGFLIAFLNAITTARVMQVAVIVEVSLWIRDEARA